MKFRVILSLAFVGLIQGASASEVPILRFREVSPGIYRGARPDADGLRALARLGFKTDLDLENDVEAVEQESQTAQNLGIRLISKPMSGFWSPDDEQVEETLSILANPANYPI